MSIGADLAHHPVREVLDEIDALLATVADASLLSLSATEQADLLLTAYERAAQLDGLVVHLVGQCDATGMADQLGAPSMTSWLKSTALLHPATAKATVDTARGIRQGMTTTGDALAAGAVSAAAAAVVVRAVADLPGGAACPAAADAERVLVEAAATLDPVTLTRLGRRVLELVDPDAADAHLGAQLEREEARARRRQHLDLAADGHGGLWLRGHLGVEDASALRAVLDPLSAPRPCDADGPDRRTAAHRNADALGEACRRLLDLGDTDRTGGQASQVVVTVDLETLRTGCGSATLVPDGDPISPGLARRLACDAAILPAVLGTEGQVLDLGRRTRLFSGSLRRALELRDGGCAFPGCDRPPKWCDGHHIDSWLDGGPTCLANGVLLCGHHHRFIHTGAWTVRMAADGLPEFLPPVWIDAARRPRRNPRPHRRQ